MQSLIQVAPASPETLAVEFFRQSAGQWHSQRRYYTLTDGETKEVESAITVRYLEAGTPELLDLAERHELSNPAVLVGGTAVSWVSNYTAPAKRKPSKGSTVFGIGGSVLYRDRGFATSKPVIAQFYFANPQTMCLRTEYNGSVFEEELKLIGQKYRTRQTIISRAEEQQMIGQYLETRLDTSSYKS
ncbi:MAG: phycobiliprotein lyase [Jaaginema sp. PMC 1079.18]|nr:phycobiliprotein lyase [Jaaginema sp. PMC 1080.18]MEC4852354.1 phycobiliprotein lyase [Jaaginema sp. PMC 1079.18]MEC4865524.1 phycobiliprotein lyase [Jaaginema sp. PMC 1078.18]